MTPQELVEKIRTWENEAGESFYDHFAHDRVSNISWAFWLIGKGFVEHGNAIIEEHSREDNTLHYVGQEELYNIYPEYDIVENEEQKQWSEENYEKNLLLMAEFLLATPVYTKRLMDWFDEN